MLTLSEIKGVGDATIKKLAELGIRSMFELFSFLPSKYIDLQAPISVSNAMSGQTYLFEGEVQRVSAVSKFGKRSFFVSFSDRLSDGKLHFKVTFFNQPYLNDKFNVGDCYRILGKLSGDSSKFEIVNPQLEKVSSISKLNGIYTVYPLRGVMGQNAFKNVLYSALDALDPQGYTGSLGEVNGDFAQCFYDIHRPQTLEDAQDALSRLSSIDLAITLALYKKLRKNSEEYRKVFYNTTKDRIDDFVNALDFFPTESQYAAFKDILGDMRSIKCMRRLISGDVGSGKTAVAFFAMFMAATSGKQAALMCPTEILAKQHAKSFEPVAERLGIKYALLTSSTPAAERAYISDGLNDGSIQCAIGTHALISEGVKFKNLSLAVIDEQHRFGVANRRFIEEKGAVDVLSLTATLIPRSMALTFYEDMDISYIQKREEAKTNVSTEIVRNVSDGVDKVISAVNAGGQAFIVCPAIKDSEGYDLMSIESFAKEYSAELSSVPCKILHGKMSAEAKQQAMQSFSSGETRLLVATTVVEVGIDTLASDILILNADRFGLATLHQLRGRVGRDGKPAHCYLQSSSDSEKATKRLGALTKHSDGQYLAELDFEMRGAGDMLGERQSGSSKTPIFGLSYAAAELTDAKEYSKKLSRLTTSELLSLTRRSESRVKAFLDALDKITLNS